MMKALIVEDERMAQAKLAAMLASGFPDISVVGMTSSVLETVEWLRANSPDIIFMDVELQDGDCFEIFRQVRIEARVIMTTAYDTYAVKAFEAGSIDYLLKPISMDDLARAVGRCRERSAGADLEALLKALAPARKQTWKKRFILRLGDSIFPVNTSDTAFFFSEDKSNYMMTSAGVRYILDETMEELESELDPEEFFRASRSCIVARCAIRSVSRQISGKLRLVVEPEPPVEMSVSRARVDDFLKWLE